MPDDINVALVLPFAFLTTLQLLGSSQALYQSYAPAVTARLSAISLLLSLPLVLLLLLGAGGLGLLARVLQASCSDYGLVLDASEPVLNLELVLEKIWAGVPGLAGFSVAALTSCALCVLSSSALGQATVVWEDAFAHCFTFAQGEAPGTRHPGNPCHLHRPRRRTRLHSPPLVRESRHSLALAQGRPSHFQRPPGTAHRRLLRRWDTHLCNLR